jgi:hypothetical protein
MRGAPAKQLARLTKGITSNVLAGQLEMPVEELRRVHFVEVADWEPDF